MDDDKTEMLIEKFFDKTLTPDEQVEFDRLLSLNPDLKRRIDDDAMVRAIICSASKPEFRPSFADDVVRDIREEMALTKLLAGQKTRKFGAGFERRLMDTIEREGSEAGNLFSPGLIEYMSRLFPKVAAPVAFAASLALAANVNAGVAGAPMIDVILGLPSIYAGELSFLSL